MYSHKTIGINVSQQLMIFLKPVLLTSNFVHLSFTSSHRFTIYGPFQFSKDSVTGG